MDLIGSIISFIVQASFGVGLFVVELLDIFDIFKLKQKGKLKEEMSSFTIMKIILSIIGGFIIMLITAMVIFLISYIFFKAL